MKDENVNFTEICRGINNEIAIWEDLDRRKTQAIRILLFCAIVEAVIITAMLCFN